MIFTKFNHWIRFKARGKKLDTIRFLCVISDVLINYSPIGSIADQFYGLKVFLSWWLDGSPFSLMKSPEFYNYNSKLKKPKQNK